MIGVSWKRVLSAVCATGPEQGPVYPDGADPIISGGLFVACVMGSHAGILVLRRGKARHFLEDTGKIFAVLISGFPRGFTNLHGRVTQKFLRPVDS